MSTWRMAMNFHFTDILQKEFFFFLHDSNECSNWIWISIICKCRKIMNAKVKMNMFIYKLYSTKLQAVCFHSAQDCHSNSNWTTFAIVSLIESGSLKVDGNWHLWSWLLLIETFSLAHLLCTTHCICVTMGFVTTITSSNNQPWTSGNISIYFLQRNERYIGCAPVTLCVYAIQPVRLTCTTYTLTQHIVW